MLAGTVMMSNAIRQHQPSSQAQQQQSAQSIYAHPASLSSNMSTTTTTTILAASQQQQQQQQQPSSHYSSTQHYSSQIYSSQQQQQYHPQNPYDIKDTVYGSGGGNGSKSYQHYNRVNHSQPIPVDLTEADHYSDGPSSAAGSGAIYRPMASRNSAHKLQQKGANSNKMTRNVSGQIEVNVSGETKRRRERDRDRDVVKDKRDDDDDEPGDDENNLDEKKKIQVQIMPQDDNWGQNTTAMTGDLSGADFNDDMMTEDGRSSMRSSRHPPAAPTQQWPGHKRRRGLVTRTIRFGLNNARQIISLLILLLSYLTPIVFVVLPRLELTTSSNGTECGHECEALLIGIAFKLFVLFVGYAAMYWIRAHRRHKLPSLFGLKTLIILVLLLVTICFWLFYYVRFMRANVDDYFHVLQFTSSHVDVLLFLFVVGVFLVELRHVKPTFVVRVMRSPDGEQREYELGDMSIECAALFILNRYYMDFKAYNPWMESAYRRRHSQFMQFEQLEAKKRARALASASSIGSTKQHRSSTKETTDETSDANNANNNNNNNFDTESIATTATRRGRNASSKPLDVQSITNIMGANLSVSERLFEESEHERRVKRKRARLVATTEEAFTHIRRIQARDLAAQNDEDAISAATGTETNSESSIGGGFRRPVINSVATAPSSLMDPFEAAQAVFTSIARDLRRYLRVTHQQPYFTRPQIISHLADCIAYDMSPKAFLQKFFAGECLLFNERALVNPFNQDKVLEYREELMKKQHKLQITDPSRAAAAAAASGLKSLDQTWILISDNSLGQGIDDNMMIVLKQSDVTLMCNFKRLPRFKLIEDVLDPKRNKFVLKLNSETTV